MKLVVLVEFRVTPGTVEDRKVGMEEPEAQCETAAFSGLSHGFSLQKLAGPRLPGHLGGGAEQSGAHQALFPSLATSWTPTPTPPPQSSQVCGPLSSLKLGCT